MSSSFSSLLSDCDQGRKCNLKTFVVRCSPLLTLLLLVVVVVILAVIVVVCVRACARACVSVGSLKTQKAMRGLIFTEF